MPYFLQRLLGIDRQARLERLQRLAAEMDELLIGSRTLVPDARRQVEDARQGLEAEIRQLLAA